MVFYALLVPLFILFCGVGLDLGWYYLNVSRLQNAADAAALAGAQTLVKQEDFNNYIVMSLASNALPADFDDYEDVFKNTFDGTGVLHNYKSIDEVKDAFNKGRIAVETYTRKNLADSEPVNATSDNVNTFSSADGWSDDTEKKS